MSDRVNIICFGNPLHGDDGFGPAVCKLLQQREWPEQVSIYDAGIRGIDAIDLFASCDHAIVIDALVDGTPAGTLQWLARDSVEAAPSSLLTHGAGLDHLLALLPECLEALPSIDILVASTEPPVPFRFELSNATAQVVPQAAAWVSEKIRLINDASA